MAICSENRNRNDRNERRANLNQGQNRILRQRENIRNNEELQNRRQIEQNQNS